VERSRFRAAKDLRSQVELRVKQQEEWVRRQVADAHAMATFARERVSLTAEARRLADEALLAEQRKLAAGGSALFFVLQLQGDRAAARVSENRARADLLQALHRLQFADGTLLERNGFRLEP
jgi:outer membrane protein TolC